MSKNLMDAMCDSLTAQQVNNATQVITTLHHEVDDANERAIIAENKLEFQECRADMAEVRLTMAEDEISDLKEGITAAEEALNPSVNVGPLPETTNPVTYPTVMHEPEDR